MDSKSLPLEIAAEFKTLSNPREAVSIVNVATQQNQLRGNRLDSGFLLLLFLSVPTIPFVQISVAGFEVTISVIIMLIYMLLKGIELLQPESRFTIHYEITFVFFLLLVWCQASIFWAEEPDLSFRIVLKCVFFYMFTVFFVNFFSVPLQSILKIQFMLPFLMTIPVCLGFYGYLSGTHWFYSFVYGEDVFGDKNTVSFMCTTVFPALVVLIASRKFATKIIALPFFFLIASASFLTYSRAGLIQGILVSAFCCSSYLFLIRGIRGLFYFIIIGCFIIGTGFMLFSSEALHSSTETWVERFQEKNSARKDFLVAGYEIVSEYPWTGVGIANFGNAFLRTNISGALAPRKYYPHNSYLAMLTELGLPGLVMFSIISVWPLSLFIRLFSKIRRCRNPEVIQCFSIGLGLAVLIITSILTIDFILFPYYWIIYGVTSSIGLTINNELNEVSHRKRQSHFEGSILNWEV